MESSTTLLLTKELISQKRRTMGSWSLSFIMNWITKADSLIDRWWNGLLNSVMVHATGPHLKGWGLILNFHFISDAIFSWPEYMGVRTKKWEDLLSMLTIHKSFIPIPTNLGLCCFRGQGKFLPGNAAVAYWTRNKDHHLAGWCSYIMNEHDQWWKLMEDHSKPIHPDPL